MPSPPAHTAVPKSLHVARDGAQTHVVLGAKAVAHGDPDRFPMLLVSMLLGGGMSSRLYQRVREDLGLAYSVYTYQSFHADSGMHGVYVATAPESTGAALDAIRTELREVVDNGLPADEVAMGRQQLKGQVTLSLESVSSRMYRAASVELYNEPFRSLDEILALIDGISVDDVARVASVYFDPERMTVVSLGPKGAE
jgi:predicted Zn-dependent peptidase